MLTYRPVIPGSDQHLALMAKCRPHMGRTLYPSLYDRRDADFRRRASAAIAAAAARVTTKQETAPVASETVSPPPTGVDGRDGCNSECA